MYQIIKETKKTNNWRQQKMLFLSDWVMIKSRLTPIIAQLALNLMAGCVSQ